IQSRPRRSLCSCPTRRSSDLYPQESWQAPIRELSTYSFSYINPSIIVNGVTGVTPLLLLSCNMSQYIYPQRGIERPGHKLLCTQLGRQHVRTPSTLHAHQPST